MKKIFYGWWIVFVCGFIGFFKMGIVSYGFTAFFEPLVKEFGWSYTQISFAKSLRGLEMSVFSPIIGFLVDRFGSRNLIFLGVFTVGLGLILLSITQSLIMFYGAFLLLAFGAGGIGGLVLVATVANWFDKNVGKAFGVVTGVSAAGGLIVPLIVWLIDVFQWRTASIILGLCIWTVGIPLSLLIHDKSKQSDSIPDGNPLHHPMMQHLKDKGKGGEIGFKEALQHRAFIYLNIVELIRHMIVSAFILHVMPYLSSVGIPRITAGMVAGAIPIYNIIARLGFGWLVDIFDKRYLMIVTLVLISAGVLGLCYMQQGWLIFISILLLSSGWGGNMIVSRTIQIEYFRRAYFGKMLGIIMGFGAIGGIIGPTLAGWVFDTLQSYQFVWLIFCGLSGLSIWLVLRIKPVMKRDV